MNFGGEFKGRIVWIIARNVRCGAAICVGSSQECQHRCERVIGLELLLGVGEILFGLHAFFFPDLDMSSLLSESSFRLESFFVITREMLTSS